MRPAAGRAFSRAQRPCGCSRAWRAPRRPQPFWWQPALGRARRRRTRPLRGTLAWFSLERRNVVSLLPGSPVLAVQIGEQSSRGFEADVTWQPIAGLSMLASYAHIDAQIVQDQIYAAGNKLDRVPADSG